MSTLENFKIAVLVACYNRKDKTLNFLNSLLRQSVFNEHTIDIFLLDDGSTDGTSDAVKQQFPFVNIVRGTGNLYWARSMRKIWQHAMKQDAYDLFCLFNDDVTLFEDALQRLIINFKKTGEGCVLIGSTLDPNTNKVSYGGHSVSYPAIKSNKFQLLEPSATEPILCRYGNANVLLVDKATVLKIGIFSDRYTHYFSDFVYTMTAFDAGLKVQLAPGYYGFCENDQVKKSLPYDQPLTKRLKYLYHPMGLAYQEHIYFIKKYFPAALPKEFIKLWMKTIFWKSWNKLKKN